jgi:hypothetical protein
MTIITREDPTDLVVRPVRPVRRQPDPRRPGAGRPQGAALHYRGTGVLMSRASHRRRPITPFATVVLALIAAAITVWLGLVAQLGGVAGASDAPAAVPHQLAVVELQAGESLHQLAQRVAPDAPADAVVDEIRELNKLDSAVVVNAGRTLIAPVG